MFDTNKTCQKSGKSLNKTVCVWFLRKIAKASETSQEKSCRLQYITKKLYLRSK